MYVCWGQVLRQRQKKDQGKGLRNTKIMSKVFKGSSCAPGFSITCSLVYFLEYDYIMFPFVELSSLVVSYLLCGSV